MRKAISVFLVSGTVVLLVAGLSAATGKPLSRTAYVKQMTAIGQRVSMPTSMIGSLTTAKGAAVALGILQIKVRNTVKDLNSMVPPAKVKALHVQLIRAAAEFANELTPIITELKAGKLQAFPSVLTLKGLRDLETARSAFTHAGYKIHFKLIG